MSPQNNGEEDLPGIDQPDTLPLAGFDIGWAPVHQAKIEPPITEAKATLDGFRSKILQGMWAEIGKAAQVLDTLREKAVNQISMPMADAAQVADGLAERVRNSLIQPIMDAAQVGRRWGVYPEPPDGSTLPGDVMEARAQLAVPGLPVPPGPNGQGWIVSPEDYTQLLLWIKANCLPLRFADPARYTQCIQQAEARFPPGSSFYRRFNADLLKLENEYSPPVTIPAAGSQSSLPAVTPQIPPGFTGSLPTPGTCPDRIPQDGDVVRAGSSAGLPDGYFQLPFSPGLYVPCWWWDPDCPGEIRYPRPPGVEDGPNHFWWYFGAYPNGKWCKYEGSPKLGCGAGALGMAINAGARLVGDCAPTSGGEFPLPIAPPGPGETPLPGEVPCVKICGFDDLVKALKPDAKKPEECGKWKAYRDVMTGECYVIKSTDKPRHSDDKLLIESADAAAIVRAVNQECGPKKEKRPEAPQEAPLAFGRGPTACDWILPPVNAEIANWKNPIGWLTGVAGQDGGPPPIAGDGVLSTIGGAVVRFLQQSFSYGFENVWKGIRGFIAGDPCFGGAAGQLAGTRTIANLLHNWFGAAIEPAMVTLQNQQNFLCPTGMPSPTEAATAYLGNTINEDAARCWIRASGMQDRLYDRVIRASRAKLNPTQIVALARRGVIQEGDVPERLRDLGYIDPTDAPELWELGKALPGPADVVRFMVRDVDDAQIVNQFGLDDEFTAKFRGLTQGYAKAAGIDEDLMRRYWRSHWSIPGPAQLLEMYHRLRNDPDVGGKRVDLETVKTALQQQDILPYWIPRLLEVSFRPLRLVDVRRAFFDGSIDLSEVRKAYEAGGYSDENADILTRHLLKQKILSLQNSKPVKAYSVGMITAAELATQLGELGFDRDQIQYGIGLARHQMSQAKRKACSQGVKKRLMRGEFSAQDAKERLLELGLDLDQAEWLAEGWACERASKGKEFSGAQLCTMYDRGLISGPEFIRRLEQVGWSRDDAVRLFTVCAQDLDRARRMADIKASREREKELEKARRQAEKDQKKIEQAVAQEQAAKNRIDRLNKARNKAVVDAGALWSKARGIDLSDAIGQAKGVYRTVYNSTTATQDVIIGALLSSVKSKQVATLAEWIAEATTIAESGVFDDPNQPPVE